jgi:hypothetical protein
MPVGAPPIQIQKKKGMGCFGCGCAIAIVLVLLLIGLVAASCYYGYHALRNFTDTAGVPIVQADGGDATYSAAQKKVDDFENAFERRQPATLHLNASEINTLLARDPAFSKLQGHLAVTLQGQEATVQSSLPLGTFENVIFPERYLNGNATFALSVDSDLHSLLFDIHQMQIHGQDIPPTSNASLNQLLNQIVNQKLQANQLARDFMASVHKADIENGELVIEIK